MIVIDLVYNLSVLIALSVLSGFIDTRYSRAQLKGKILQGLLFGVTAIIGMLYPFHLAEGIIFDGRSIVISLCALFFGPVSGSISAVVAIIFRQYLGGGGAIVGSSVILSSFLIGLYFFQRRKRQDIKYFTNFQLYIFGLAVNTVMLILFLMLPYKDMIGMYKVLLPTILGVYPFASLLIGKILLDQEEKQSYINKLKTSEERWQFALEGAGDGVWDWDASSDKVFFSHQWKAMLGYNDNEVENTFEAWEKLLHPDDKANVFEELDKHFNGEIPLYQSEQRLKCKDGSYKWILDRGKVIQWDNDGKPIRIIGTHTDISERIFAEIVLKESEEKYRTILKSAIDGFWMLDKNGWLLEVNDTYCKMSGYTMQELLSLNISDLVYNETSLDLTIHRQKIKENGEDRFESIHRRKDGSVFDVELSVQYKETNGGRWVAFLKDITEQKISEKKLIESQERFKLAFETSPDAVNINRMSDGLYLEINEGFTRTTGYTKEDVIGKTSLEINIWENPDDRAKLVSGLKNGGHVTNLETKFRLKNGNIIYGLMSASIILLKNEPHIISITRDITERKYAEDKIRENEEIFRELLKHSPVYIFFKDENIRSIRLSKNYEQMLNMPLENMIGKNIDELFPSDLAKNILADDKKILQKGELIRVEEELNGHFYTTIKFPIKIEGKPRYIAGFTIDITERKKAEEALLESKILFQTLANVSPVGIFRTDANGYTTYVNPRWCNISGLSFEDGLGNGWLKAVHPDDRETIKKGWQDSTTIKAESYADYRFLKNDGSIRWVMGQAIPEKNSENQVVGYIGTITDITDRKHAEETLRGNEEKMRTIVEGTPHLFFYTQNTKAELTYISPTVEKISGYSPDKWLKTKDWFTTDSKINKLAKERTRAHLRGEHFSESINIEIFHSNGDIVTLEVFETPIYQNGKVVGLQGVAHDITDRKRAEEEIRKLFRGVEQSPASVVITDVKGNIEYVNKKFCDVTGYDYDEIIGNNQSLLGTGERSEEEDMEMWDTILSGKDWHGEFHNKKKNGELYWESASISPIQNEIGEITHFIEIKEDITEKKKMIDELISAKEKAEEMSRLKSNFLANMSHELRTPLVGILGYADYLRREVNSQDIKNMAETIFNSGARLSETLNLILDLSKFETEKKDIKYQKIEIISISKEIIALFNEVARKKQIELKLLFNHEPIIINFDQRAFRSIITNLVNNAIKFTSEGSVVCDIALSNNSVVIKVIDTGIGIAKNDFQIIFDEFRQASEGYSRNFEGSGLGLSITKKLVDKFGGTISIESEVGKGSTFIVELPYANDEIIPNNQTITKLEETRDMRMQKQEKPIALLVDDDPIVFQVMKRYTSEYIQLETAFKCRSCHTNVSK